MTELLKFIGYQKAAYERGLKYQAERKSEKKSHLYTEKEHALLDLALKCDKDWIRKLEMLAKGEYTYINWDTGEEETK